MSLRLDQLKRYSTRSAFSDNEWDSVVVDGVPLKGAIGPLKLSSV
jgi:hypothetical protein